MSASIERQDDILFVEIDEQGLFSGITLRDGRKLRVRKDCSSAASGEQEIFVEQGKEAR